MRKGTALAALLAAFFIAACDANLGQAQNLVRDAKIERIELFVFESFPVQIRVVAYGYLPDGCTKIAKIEEKREGSLFTVRITTTRPAAAICTQAIVKFQETFPLDLAGLKAGAYTVNVNGIRESFTLSSDNEAP